MPRSNHLLGAVLLVAMFASSAYAAEPLRIGVPTELSGTYARLATKPCARSRLPPRKRMPRVASPVTRSKYKSYDTEAKPEVARRQAEKSFPRVPDPHRTDRFWRRARHRSSDGRWDAI